MSYAPENMAILTGLLCQSSVTILSCMMPLSCGMQEASSKLNVDTAVFAILSPTCYHV